MMGLYAKSDAPKAFVLYEKTAHAKKYFNHGVITLHANEGGEHETLLRMTPVLQLPTRLSASTAHVLNLRERF